MSATPFADLNALAAHLRRDAEDDQKIHSCSMPTTARQDAPFDGVQRFGKQDGDDERDTLYFNAFTEDLFSGTTIWKATANGC